MSDRARRAAIAAACAALLGVLGGCANRGTVVLIPADSGEKTAVTVRQDGRELLLDEPYAAANFTHLFGAQPYRSSADEVQARFGATLAARPEPPATFVLYFVEGNEALTDDSSRLLDTIVADIAKRPAPEVSVVGHTDTIGNEAFNDALGLRRAEAVVAVLVQRGVAAADIVASSRGERDLAVSTADDVAEPRNRRVVIVVR
jgi:outer membrane protein OmpA-like peptidoglycan-associated protein